LDMAAKHVKYAKLFRNGSSQAVRLPQEFRFDGDKVRIRRFGTGVILEPETFDLKAWLDEMDAIGGSFEIERDQPPPQERDIFD
jgi:antitoxin VapB